MPGLGMSAKLDRKAPAQAASCASSAASEAPTMSCTGAGKSGLHTGHESAAVATERGTIKACPHPDLVQT